MLLWKESCWMLVPEAFDEVLVVFFVMRKLFEKCMYRERVNTGHEYPNAWSWGE
jgi:hypothetical protein